MFVLIKTAVIMVWELGEEGRRTGVEETSIQRGNSASIVTSNRQHQQTLQGDSRLLSEFPFIDHRNPDNNFESSFIFTYRI